MVSLPLDLLVVDHLALVHLLIEHGHEDRHSSGQLLRDQLSLNQRSENVKKFEDGFRDEAIVERACEHGPKFTILESMSYRNFSVAHLPMRYWNNVIWLVKKSHESSFILTLAPVVQINHFSHFFKVNSNELFCRIYVYNVYLYLSILLLYTYYFSQYKSVNKDAIYQGYLNWYIYMRWPSV